MIIAGKIPANYLEGFGEYEATAEDIELLDEEIAKRLPDGVSWCGDELLADEETDIDVEEIIGEAYKEVFSKMWGY